MTIFTAVSIALSTSGATFAALTQLSNLFDSRVTAYGTGADNALTTISESYGSDTASFCLANRRHKRLKGWLWHWKYCSLIPIATLLIFSVWVGVKVAYATFYSIGEEIRDGDRLFFTIWISVILSVNVLTVIWKFVAWIVAAWTCSSLCETERGIKEHGKTSGAMAVRPIPANTSADDTTKVIETQSKDLMLPAPGEGEVKPHVPGHNGGYG